MSQFDPPAGHQSDFELDADPQRKQSNPAGIVGFILSLLCITAPIGLLVSLFALTKRPKGFAIAGAIIGLLLTGLLVFVGLGAVRIWPEMKNVFEGQAQYVEIKSAVRTYQSANNGQVPPDLAALSLPADTLTDPWGTPWGYEPSADGTSFAIISAGPDQQMGTTDDARLEQSLRDQDVYKELGEAVERHYENKGTP